MNLARFADGHLTEVVADGNRVSLRLEAYVEYGPWPNRPRRATRWKNRGAGNTTAS